MSTRQKSYARELRESTEALKRKKEAAKRAADEQKRQQQTGWGSRVLGWGSGLVDYAGRVVGAVVPQTVQSFGQRAIQTVTPQQVTRLRCHSFERLHMSLVEANLQLGEIGEAKSSGIEYDAQVRKWVGKMSDMVVNLNRGLRRNQRFLQHLHKLTGRPVRDCMDRVLIDAIYDLTNTVTTVHTRVVVEKRDATNLIQPQLVSEAETTEQQQQPQPQPSLITTETGEVYELQQPSPSPPPPPPPPAQRLTRPVLQRPVMTTQQPPRFVAVGQPRPQPAMSRAPVPSSTVGPYYPQPPRYSPIQQAPPPPQPQQQQYEDLEPFDEGDFVSAPPSSSQSTTPLYSSASVADVESIGGGDDDDYMVSSGGGSATDDEPYYE